MTIANTPPSAVISMKTGRSGRNCRSLLARVETVVADMGYCDAAELGMLQEAGIRTAVADPVRNRLAPHVRAYTGRGLRRLWTCAAIP